MRRLADVLAAPVILVGVVVVGICGGLLFGETALAVSTGPGWTIRSVAQPTNLSSTGNKACENSGGGRGSSACDSYALIVTNVGSRPVPAGVPVTIADTLPADIHVFGISARNVNEEEGFGCSKIPVQCVDGSGVPVGDTLVVTIYVTVEETAEEQGAVNEASVAGGGGPAVVTSEPTFFGAKPAPFGIEDFALQAFDADGLPSAQAGGHPYALATSLDFTSENTTQFGAVTYHPSEEVKERHS